MRLFVLGNLLGMTANLLDFAFQGLMLVLLINALLSWFPSARDNPAAGLLDRISDTVCSPIRQMIPTAGAGMDFAPLIMMVLLQFVGRGFVVPTLRDIAFRLG